MAIKYTKNLLPGSGVIIRASSAYGSGTSYAVNLINGVKGTENAWLSNGITNQWLTFEFANPVIISKYALFLGYTAATCPKKWNFEYWDGSNWVILDSRDNITNWVANVSKEFTITPLNKNAYSMYRLYIFGNNGGGNYISLGEVEMMGLASHDAIINIYEKDIIVKKDDNFMFNFSIEPPAFFEDELKSEKINNHTITQNGVVYSVALDLDKWDSISSVEVK